VNFGIYGFPQGLGLNYGLYGLNSPYSSWVPRDNPNLIFQGLAKNIAQSVGSNVTAWKDESLKSNNVTSVINSPILDNDVAPFIRFSSSSNNALTSNFNLSFSATRKISIVKIIKSFSTVNSTYLSLNPLNGEDYLKGFSTYYNTSQGGELNLFGDGLSNYNSKIYTTINTNRRLTSFSYTSSAINIFRENGLNLSPTTGGGSSLFLDIAQPVQRLVVGGRTFTTGFNVDITGDVGIYALLIFNDALSLDELLKAEGFLCWQCNSIDLLPNSHPYKLFAP
jgi:hypothetical protein